MDWLERGREERRNTLLRDYPTIEQGMFVQSIDWFDNVWAEITGVYMPQDDTRYASVNFTRYEKYGVTRRPNESLYLGSVRAFAMAHDIQDGNLIIYRANQHSSYGVVIDWPQGPHRQRYNYEEHPTITLEQSRAMRNSLWTRPPSVEEAESAPSFKP